MSIATIAAAASIAVMKTPTAISRRRFGRSGTSRSCRRAATRPRPRQKQPTVRPLRHIRILRRLDHGEGRALALLLHGLGDLGVRFLILEALVAVQRRGGGAPRGGA